MLKQLYNLNFEREFYLTAAVELMCKKIPASFEDRRMKGKKEQVKYLRTISEDVHSCEVAWKPPKIHIIRANCRVPSHSKYLLIKELQSTAMPLVWLCAIKRLYFFHLGSYASSLQIDSLQNDLWGTCDISNLTVSPLIQSMNSTSVALFYHFH